jgi:hypothetical protein
MNVVDSDAAPAPQSDDRRLPACRSIRSGRRGEFNVEEPYDGG